MIVRDDECCSIEQKATCRYLVGTYLRLGPLLPGHPLQTEPLRQRRLVTRQLDAPACMFGTVWHTRNVLLASGVHRGACPFFEHTPAWCVQSPSTL